MTLMRHLKSWVTTRAHLLPLSMRAPDGWPLDLCAWVVALGETAAYCWWLAINLLLVASPTIATIAAHLLDDEEQQQTHEMVMERGA